MVVALRVSTGQLDRAQCIWHELSLRGNNAERTANASR